MNKRSFSNRSQDMNIDGSNVNSSQLGQGENVTQIQSGKFFHISLFSLGALGDTLPEYIDSFEKKIIGISVASSGLGFLVLIIAKNVLSDVVVPSTLIGSIIFILLFISLSFVTARIIIRYIRSKGTFWHSLEERDRQIIDAYLEKVHRGIKENFENSFKPKENYVSLSGDLSGDVYPHQAYEEKAPKFRRQISNLDSYILSPVNKQVFLYGPPGSGKSTTLYKTFLTYKAEMLNLVTKLNISRRSNPKMTKLACKDNPSEPVYITRILTHEAL